MFDKEKCKKPDPPTYGTIKCDDKLIVGSKCEFKCEEGYEMVGKPRRFAKKLEPKCTPHPPKPEDGFVDCDNVVATAGTICQYKCKSGHKLIGSENTVCEETARGVVEWSHKAPTCKKTCEKPETIDHGTVKCDKPDKSLIEGAVCDFECDDGFNMKGQKNAICKADGTWSAKPPTCEEPKECEKWNEFENGKMSCKPKTKFVEGTRCDFKCDDGYVMIPGWKNYTMCNASLVSTEVGLKTELHWTNQLPCCGKVTCDKDAKMDLVIVMDSSGSINPLGKNGPDYYSKMKNFLVDLIDGFKGDGFHFGVVRFNTVVVKEDTILLDKYIGNKAGIKKAILGFDGPGGKTATAAAIKYVRKEVLPSGREGVSDAILVVTDGAATDVKDLPAEIKAIRDGGVDTFALAIGPKVGETVDIIAGTDDNKIIISDMEGLTKELIDKVLSKFCSNTCEGK
uniref:E-selectin-like n=1 Tax=Styela clava TaxID=7725 RepID=UPI001939D4AB|nr:E-selectin-like [Styela clava]